MAVSIFMLVFSLAFILLVCAIFTNAVEWFGQILDLSQGVTGSILAAVGTALPETIIPIIALVFSRGDQAEDVGIGAIAGAPFMLGTLGFFITGLAVIIYSSLGKRDRKMNVNIKNFSRDITFFIIVYGIAILTTFIRNYGTIKLTVAVALILSYVVYVRLNLKDSNDDNKEEQELEEFYITKFLKVKTNLFWVVIQLMLALAGIVYGAHMFVSYVEVVSEYIEISPLILSIIVTPIATELPEKLNSIIWVGKKKDTLALGNITGAMVFQSCFPVAFGIMLTAWDIEGITMVCASLVLISAAINLIWVKIKKEVNPYMLLSGAGLYAIFLVYVFR